MIQTVFKWMFSFSFHRTWYTNITQTEIWISKRHKELIELTKQNLN